MSFVCAPRMKNSTAVLTPAYGLNTPEGIDTTPSSRFSSMILRRTSTCARLDPNSTNRHVEAVLAAAQPRPRFAGVFVLWRPALWRAAAVVVIALTASFAIKFWPRTPVPLAGERASVATQAAATETSWDAESVAVSEHIRLAQADVAIGSSLDNRIAGLRDALSELRNGSDGF